MVYEMNKSFVTKVFMMSTVLMAGILLIPTNIHDAKANPCTDVGLLDTGGNGGAGGHAGPAGNGEMVEIEESMSLVDLVEVQEMLEMVEKVEPEQVH